jgi:5,6-dimethylbenzimidazole synthase
MTSDLMVVPDLPGRTSAAARPIRDDREALLELLVWRRDVRSFTPDPVPGETITRLLDAACLAPSVGLSQPWRFVLVESPERRQAAIAEFEHCNAVAAADYPEAQAAAYRQLKLSGMREAPVHLAVCCEQDTPTGHGLGRQTVPQTLRDSVVCAIHTLWLAAQTEGLGVGWVSILRPEQMRQILALPVAWDLVGYLNIGWPAHRSTVPELERQGWEIRRSAQSLTVRR